VLSFRSRSLAILALPLVVAEAQSRDAILMAIPFLLLLCTFTAGRVTKIGRGEAAALLVIAAATGAIPLVKGSFGATSLFLLGLSAVFLIRRRNLSMVIGVLIACAIHRHRFTFLKKDPNGTALRLRRLF
jgi:hypothetical protein